MRGDMALKEKRIRAYIQPFMITSIMPFVQELNYEVPLRLISAPGSRLDSVLSKNPYFRKDILPAKIYGEMTDHLDLASIGVPEIVICQSALSDDLVYRITGAIFIHLDELYLYTPIAKVWTSDLLASTVLPYHPRAVKYYSEKKLGRNSWRIDRSSFSSNWEDKNNL